jgi:tetratricopeptide (TPR) repeat protein
MPALDARLFHAESTMMRHTALLLTLFLVMFIPESRTFAQTDPFRPRAKVDTDPFQLKANVGKARATALRHNALGEVLLRQKSYDQAIVEFEAAMKADPEFAAPYNNRGLARDSKRDYDLAIADFSEAIRIDPMDALSYNDRAWLWATCPDGRHRNGPKAVVSATRACELTDWQAPDELDTLAAACAETGDFDAAVKWQAKALELTKDEKDKEEIRARLDLYRAGKPYRAEPVAR